LDEKGFMKFCAEKNLDERTIAAHVGMVKEFEGFLKKEGKNKTLSNAASRDLEDFVAFLMKDGKNTWENFVALVRYARFVNNREVQVALLELVDGSDVLENLSETLKKTVSKNKRNEVFEGIALPSLGTNSKDKPKITKKFMERLEAKLDDKMCREVLSSGPHASPKEAYLPERKKFLASECIDDFLKKRHEEYVGELEEHMKSKTLYFTQEIDEEVVEYVRNTPTCQNGVREGDVIIVTKIPYMAKKYLHERDEKMKRYYACHCAWVREAIRSGMKISPNFCYCSAGFEKRPWDVIFDQPVEADVLQTVLKGDFVCKFAIHIPKEFQERKDDTQKSRI
jgi:hypothetical protein